MYKLTACTKPRNAPKRENKPMMSEAAVMASKIHTTQPIHQMLGLMKSLKRAAWAGTMEYTATKPLQSHSPLVRASGPVLTAKSGGQAKVGGIFQSNWSNHKYPMINRATTIP